MEELNLLNYLVPDIQVFSIIHNSKKIVLRIEPDEEFPIVIGEKKKGIRQMRFNQQGSVLKGGKDCLLFPDKDTHTWEGYVTPTIYKKGDIVKAYAANGTILIAIYFDFDTKKQIHRCFHSIDENGNVIFAEYEKVDKFRQSDGYLYCRTAYNKMHIGKIEKENEQNLD